MSIEASHKELYPSDADGVDIGRYWLGPAAFLVP
jgi:hypothetical protein